MVHIKVEAKLPMPAAAYWHERNLRGFMDLCCERLSMRSIEEIKCIKRPDGSVAMRRLRTVPNVELPAVMSRLLGGAEFAFEDELEYIETEPFAANVRTIPGVLPDKSTIAGVLRVVPIDARTCLQTFELDVIVSVFGVGRVVEGVVVTNLKKTYENLPAVVEAWTKIRRVQAAPSKPPAVVSPAVAALLAPAPAPRPPPSPSSASERIQLPTPPPADKNSPQIQTRSTDPEPAPLLPASVSESSISTSGLAETSAPLEAAGVSGGEEPLRGPEPQPLVESTELFEWDDTPEEALPVADVPPCYITSVPTIPSVGLIGRWLVYLFVVLPGYLTPDSSHLRDRRRPKLSVH
eukprot:TRINITY_DN981_c0_g1_i1.p1 TRINITY_DN981_c0_g1~~TRINITY_DN981_c0_g1_i1.p1  ORF type:complete len:350 (-),score=62.19 TRINITY_DN981_c0_g1_i1:71-1120(-)